MLTAGCAIWLSHDITIYSTFIQLIYLKQEEEKYKSSLELLLRHELHKTQCKVFLTTRDPPGIGSIRQVVPAGATCLAVPPSLCCPTSYKELNSFHFAFHLQLSWKFSSFFAVHLKSRECLEAVQAGHIY